MKATTLEREWCYLARRPLSATICGIMISYRKYAANMLPVVWIDGNKLPVPLAPDNILALWRTDALRGIYRVFRLYSGVVLEVVW